MKKDKNRTVVIFRAYVGDTIFDLKKAKIAYLNSRTGIPLERIVAIFPMWPAGNKNYCGSYMSGNRYGECDPKRVMLETVAIPKIAYAPLKRELEKDGFNLLLRKRLHPSYFWRTASMAHSKLASEGV